MVRQPKEGVSTDPTDLVLSCLLFGKQSWSYDHGEKNGDRKSELLYGLVLGMSS